MAEDRDDLGHLATGARAAPAATSRQTKTADGPDPVRTDGPTRSQTEDASPDPSIGPPRAPTGDAFPNPSIGPAIVLYQRADHGLAVRWHLDPKILAGARAAFAAEATPQLVMQVTRVGSGDGATRIPLDLGQGADAVPVDGDTRFPPPTGNGAIEAEIGFQTERGGWMLVARSNRLDAIGPVGVPFLRGDRDGGPWPVRTDAPAAPVGAGWAATIAADAAARLNPRSGSQARTRPATAPADGIATNRGDRPDAPAPTSAASSSDASGAVVPAPRLPGPFPLWRQGATASPAIGNGASARSAPASGPVHRSAEGMAGRLAGWLAGEPLFGPAPTPEPAPEPAPGPAPETALGPAIAAVGGLPTGPTAAVPIPARLPTRGLELPPVVALAPNAADTPFRLVVMDAGAGVAAQSPQPAVVPVAGSGPVVRPGTSGDASLRAELILYGSAAPGSLVDLGDHRYRVGPGGRFMLRLPLTDRALILQVLAQLPDLPVLDRDAAHPVGEAPE